MQFIYGTGIDTFAAKAKELAGRHGPGFEITDPVRAAIEKFKPSY